MSERPSRPESRLLKGYSDSVSHLLHKKLSHLRLRFRQLCPSSGGVRLGEMKRLTEIYIKSCELSYGFLFSFLTSITTSNYQFYYCRSASITLLSNLQTLSITNYNVRSTPRCYRRRCSSRSRGRWRWPSRGGDCGDVEGREWYHDSPLYGCVSHSLSSWIQLSGSIADNYSGFFDFMALGIILAMVGQWMAHRKEEKRYTTFCVVSPSSK